MMELPDNFADLTPEQQELLALLLAEQGVEMYDSALAPRKQPGEDAPLSFSQARLWFLDQLEPNSPMYNMPAAARLHGTLSVPVLQACLDEIAARHEVLRTIFVRGDDGQAVQHILPELHVPITTADLSGLAAAAQEQEILRLASAEIQRPFDLARGPLLRVMLLVLSESDVLLLLNMHHIITDGWSVGVFLRELGALYGAFAKGRPSPLTPLPLQYGDYALWQRESLRGQTLEQQLAYWREALRDAPAVLELPLDRPRPPVQTHRGAALDVTIGAPVQAALNQLAQSEGATLFMTLLAAFQVFLSRYSRMSDVCIGTPIANRTRGELEGLIGFFTNTLVIRARIAPGMTFRQFLRSVRDATLAAYEHQDVPFEQIVEAVHPERTMSYSPLFQVMFALQNVPQQAVELPGIRLSSASFPSVTAKFDLTLNLGERGDGIGGSIEYNLDLFDETTVQRMIQNLGVLIEAVAIDPDQAVGALPIMTHTERALVMDAWNDTAMAFPADTTIHALIAEWAERTPDGVAAEFAELTEQGLRTTPLTYRELHDRANRLAHHLRQLGVGTDAERSSTFVGLSVTRSLEMVVGILGILRAGGAYLPLDPGYPADRLAFMIADSGTRILVTEGAIASRLPLSGAGVPPDLAVVRIDEDWNEIAAQPPTDPHAAVGPDDPVYCIYTSGSTGRPKGTPVRHRSICSLATAAARDFDMAPGKRVLQFAAFSFDASVWETTMALRNGATLILARQEVLASGPELLRLLKLARITTVILPPALAAVLEPVPLPDLTTVLCGGERVTNQMVRRWAPGRRFINAYGPTETTVCATMRVCHETEVWPFGGPPIGRPVANLRCYVVDDAGAGLQLQPVGVAGELVIAGVGVSQGYLNRPELSAERFIAELPAPVARSANGAEAGPISGPLYRTGDLVRWLPGGEIEYLGRMDDQVKVRGFRIELGEIESVLRGHPDVKDGLVTVRGDALVGYYIPKGGEATIETGRPAATELRAHLRQHLPEYMVPAVFVPMTSFPLSPAQKVDRRLLPPPNQVAGNEYVAPRTPTEELLASVWTQLLNVPRVGADDSFFELGGHSLSATQLVSRARAAFGVEVPLRALFETPTLSGLAAAIDHLRAAALDTVAPPIASVPRQGDADGKVRLPLSFAQQRLWFLDQFEGAENGGTSLYNIPVAVRLKGRLDGAALSNTLAALAERHESLRTSFESVDGKPVQAIAPHGALSLNVVDLSDVEEAEVEAAIMTHAEAEAGRPFVLASGPLVRVTLLRLHAEEHVLLFTMHHIISDGWSSGVLIREFGELYAALASGANIQLAPLALQYADYAVWQRKWLLDRAGKDDRDEAATPLQKQLAYWREALKGAPALLELPTDRPRPAVPSHGGAAIAFELPADLTERVRRLNREEGATVFMTLMAAFQALLSRLSAQTDILVGTPVANRTHAELEGIIGFFVNTLIMRAQFGDGPSFRRLLGQVRTAALGAYAYQDVPFEKLVDELEVVRDASHSPLFQVMFVWQEQRQSAMSAPITLPGLSLSPIPVHGGTATFDLTLAMADGPRGLSGWLEYSTDLFDRSTAERFVRLFETLLTNVLATPDLPIAQVPLLTAEERRMVVEDWNDTAVPVPAVSLHGAFEQQVARTPDAVALVFAGDGGSRLRCEVTYAELNRRADGVASELQRLGVRREEIVAISVEKSVEQIAGLLGILKAGAAYLPIDPAYPTERIAYLLADSGAQVLLTQSHLAQGFAGLHLRHVVCLDEFVEAQRAGQAALASQPLAPAPHTSADSLAYVIYTSGSTGQPKGVMVEHRNIVNHAHALMAQTGIGPGDRMLQFVSLSFDAAGEEFYPTLLSGATLVLPADSQALLGTELPAFCEVHGITLLHMPATAWHGVIDGLSAQGEAWRGPLRLLMLGGDAPDPARLIAFRKLLDREIPFINLYGPTEATITATTFQTTGLTALQKVPIGRPIANAAVYVLDAAGQPSPIGVPGEIYIGGAGVARGYLGRPELTAEKFVQGENLTGSPATRLYRTGDLARWLPDGNLEFVGRADDQVKVRGYRIELGEIEVALAAHPEVKECAVLARADAGDGGRRLVAYFVPAADPAPSVADLRAFLSKIIPDHMVPAVFVRLPALPLNAHGKVDRRALPAPSEAQQADSGAEFLAATTPAERALADIWQQVLGVPHVGAHDNFFELGGDSILSIQVVSRAQPGGTDHHAQAAVPGADALRAGRAGRHGHDRLCRAGARDGPGPAYADSTLVL